MGDRKLFLEECRQGEEESLKKGEKKARATAVEMSGLKKRPYRGLGKEGSSPPEDQGQPNGE